VRGALDPPRCPLGGGGGSRSGEGGDLYRLDLFGELHQEALAEEERVYKVCVFVGRFVLCVRPLAKKKDGARRQ
jgi:hypothetical protein